LNQETSRGAAIEARVEVTPEVYEAERQAITFNYFCLPHGYGWVFPTSEGTLNCGVCAWAGRPHLPRAVDDFLARSFPPGAIRQVQTHGHVIPLYSGHRQIATRRVCLVGDAASLVDPISGEGIRFALESGALAADVIAEQAGAAGGADCRAYQSAIHEGIGQYLEHLRRFVQFIFLDAPEFFYQKFILEGVNYARVASRLEVGAGGQL
jgi:flavin-dependent dehydrogenase